MQICYHSEWVIAAAFQKLFGDIWKRDIKIEAEKNINSSRFKANKRVIKVFCIGIYCNKRAKKENNGFFKVEKNSCGISGLVFLILIRKLLLKDL